MSSETVVNAAGLGKRFELYEKPYHRLLQAMLPRKQRRSNEFWAVRDVSFRIGRGETVGIVGRNGSGKSTLLQVLCGIITPTEGQAEVQGRVAAMLALGAGFNPDFTGRENVFLNATLYGLSPDEINAKLERILSFAEIGSFIDQPVRTYSSGMYVRLGFAVMAHLDADILIVDEALSVGDAYFVQKCMRFLREFQRRGTLLFVSHDSGAVVNLCTRALLLDAGRLVMDGEPKDVTDAYLERLYSPAGGESKVRKPAKGRVAIGPNKQRASSSSVNQIHIGNFESAATGFGVGGASVVDVWLEKSPTERLSVIAGGERVRLCIRSNIERDVVSPIIGFVIKDRLGQALFGENTNDWLQVAPASPGLELTASFEFDMPLLPSGHYAVTVAIADGTQEDHVPLDWIHEALVFESHYANGVVSGLVGIPMHDIALERRQSSDATQRGAIDNS